VEGMMMRKESILFFFVWIATAGNLLAALPEKDLAEKKQNAPIEVFQALKKMGLPEGYEKALSAKVNSLLAAEKGPFTQIRVHEIAVQALKEMSIAGKAELQAEQRAKAEKAIQEVLERNFTPEVANQRAALELLKSTEGVKNTCSVKLPFSESKAPSSELGKAIERAEIDPTAKSKAELTAAIISRWDNNDGIMELLGHVGQLRSAGLISQSALDVEMMSKQDRLIWIEMNAKNLHDGETGTEPWIPQFLLALDRMDILRKVPGYSETLVARAALRKQIAMFNGLRADLSRRPSEPWRQTVIHMCIFVEAIGNKLISEVDQHSSELRPRGNMTAQARARIAGTAYEEFTNSPENLATLYDMAPKFIADGYFNASGWKYSDFFGHTPLEAARELARSGSKDPIAREKYVAQLLAIFEKLHVAIKGPDNDPRKAYATNWLQTFFDVELKKIEKEPETSREGLELLSRLIKFYNKLIDSLG
jgi:hypothetical protein